METEIGRKQCFKYSARKNVLTYGYDPHRHDCWLIGCVHGSTLTERISSCVFLNCSSAYHRLSLSLLSVSHILTALVPIRKWNATSPVFQHLEDQQQCDVVKKTAQGAGVAANADVLPPTMLHVYTRGTHLLGR